MNSNFILTLALFLVASQNLVSSDDPCNRVPDLSISSFQAIYKGKHPVVFSSTSYQNSTFKRRVTRESLLSSYAGADVVLASSNSNSHDKRHSRFDEYVYSSVDNAVLPNTSALNNWYFFGDTPMVKDSIWANLISLYELPLDAELDDGLPTFGVGGKHSGVAFHTHGAAFGETIIGKKMWYLSPPSKRPTFNSSTSQLDWTLSFSSMESNKDVAKCLVSEGEIIYIPPNWWHATLNIESWNSFVSTFTREKMSLTLST